MGLEDIEKHILEEAALEANKIKEQAEDEVIKIIDSARKTAEEKHNAILKEAEKEAERIRKSILVPVRLKAKKDILTAKYKLINKTFAGVSEKKREQAEIKVARVLFA